MALCDQCRKDRAVDTQWDILRSWLFKRLFPKDYVDLAEEKYTKGFGEGYAKGLQSAASHKDDLARVQAEYFKNNPDNETVVKKSVLAPAIPHARTGKRRNTHK